MSHDAWNGHRVPGRVIGFQEDVTLCQEGVTCLSGGIFCLNLGSKNLSRNYSASGSLKNIVVFFSFLYWILVIKIKINLFSFVHPIMSEGPILKFLNIVTLDEQEDIPYIFGTSSSHMIGRKCLGWRAVIG